MKVRQRSKIPLLDHRVIIFAKTHIAFLSLLCSAALCRSVHPAPAAKLTPEMLGKPREAMRFSDRQVRLFNGRGCAYVRQNSLTGIQAVQFPPIDLPQYRFRIDFRDNESGTLIQDNMPDLWEDWKDKKSGYDPLGVNLRAGYPTALLSQEEYWQPNSYRREGTFHKQIRGRWLSFAIITETLVSGSDDEVYLEVQLTNRSETPLSLTCIPVQGVRFNDSTEAGRDQFYRKLSPFILQNALYRISLGSDLTHINQDGWEWLVSPGSTDTGRFVIQVQSSRQDLRATEAIRLAPRLQAARETTRRRLSWVAEKLPELKTEYKNLDEFYQRCMLTMAECKWERDNFIVNPFWSAGSWIYTIPWDMSFVSDLLAMQSPKSLQETIALSFSEGQLDCSNIGWDGCAPGVFYIMQPFALQTMINAYIRHTGDAAILQKQIADKTLLAWMKEWATLLVERYRSKASGMIDIANDTEALVEIRTDGYDHIVPVVNGLTVEFYKWLARRCRENGDGDSLHYARSARDLEERFHKNLWNAKTRWFDNLYADGGRKSVYSNLLFDLLGTEVLTAEERLGLVSHLNDNEFLGPFSIFSISRQDQVHWDRVDADWGGGGAYTGTVMQLVRNLYKMEMGQQAWTILKRFAQFAEHFPYISQNYRADELFQDEASMPLAICAGSGVEAMIFGLFGFAPHSDGTLDIRPVYSYDLGQAELRDFQFREHRYDLAMNRYGFTVTRDGKPYGPYRHGQSVRVFSDGRLRTHEEMQVAAPTAQTDSYRFVSDTQVRLVCATPEAVIRYTLDGSRPTLKSPIYRTPFSISQTCRLKAQAFLADGTFSEVSTIYFEKIKQEEMKKATAILSDFLISQSFRGYLGPEGKGRYPFSQQTMKWKKAIADDRGIVWLDRQLEPFADCHAFAVTEIITEKAMATHLLIGTNDGAFVWLNDELILDNYRERPFYYNQFTLPVRLKKGGNKLVLLILQSGGSWGFNVNIELNTGDFKCTLPRDLSENR